MVRVAARAVHLASICAVVGGALWQHPAGGWTFIAVASGSVLLADDVRKSGKDYLRYVQGWVMALKLALLIVAALAPAAAASFLMVVVVIAGIISHAPGAVRQQALWGNAGPCAQEKGCAVKP